MLHALDLYGSEPEQLDRDTALQVHVKRWDLDKYDLLNLGLPGAYDLHKNLHIFREPDQGGFVKRPFLIQHHAHRCVLKQALLEQCALAFVEQVLLGVDDEWLQFLSSCENDSLQKKIVG